MKIQYKASFVMLLFGVAIIILLSLGYDFLYHQTILNKELRNMKNLSDEISEHVNSRIQDFASIGVTLSSVPVIKSSLTQSNADFLQLSETARQAEINRLNERWKNTKDSNDPFIRTHMNNSVARFLKEQQTILPKRYGEIFLTNRFGVMISTTGKLTTLAHAHKYWWQAAFNDGKGRIFLDDRGFDKSVSGYVLGIVIPVRDGQEIIGILKCNVNIMGPLTDVVRSFIQRHFGKLQIVRSGGLVVAERDIVPLSVQVADNIQKLLKQKVAGTAVVEIDQIRHLVAYSPILTTKGSSNMGIGGSQESIDHIKGNKGEGWHILISISEKDALYLTHDTNITIIVVGLIFTLVTAVIALVLGRKAAKPIKELSGTAKLLGQGNLDSRVTIQSNDEFGTLSNSLNKMAKNFQDTIITRDKLIDEVKQKSMDLEVSRKEAEKSSRAKSIFIANMSHQFRTPLNAVIGFSKEMLDSHSISEKYQEYLRIINSNGQQQLALINDVIAMSEFDEGNTTLKPETVDLRKMLVEIIKASKQMAEAKGLQLSIQGLDRLPALIYLDGDKFKQILFYVIENAVTYTEEGEITIKVGCQATDNSKLVKLLLEVKDTGVGIPVEFQEQIFHPFVQLDEQNSCKGTGLRLTLTRRFLELMGGSISVESKVGIGSIFHLNLPVQKISDTHFGIEELLDIRESQEFKHKLQNEAEMLSGQLKNLNPKQLNELSEAVSILDQDRVLEIVKQFEATFPELADNIKQRIESLDFKLLQELLSQLNQS